MARYENKPPIDNGFHIPSFAAVKSLLDSSAHVVTKYAFTPILPFPETEYDAIFTTMINFQDVLKQMERENGLLRSDEGCTILQRKYSSYIHKNLVIYSLGLAASI